MDSYESSPINNTVKWLEDEQRQSKALNLKIQQQLDQFQATMWTQTEQLHLLEDSVSAMKNTVSQLPKLEDNLRQITEALGRAQEARDELKQRIDDMERVWTNELTREREERSQLVKQLGELTGEMQALLNKTQLIDEASHHIQENLTRINAQVESLLRHDDILDAKISLIQESQKHTDQNIKRLDRDQEILRSTDEMLQGRLLSLGERVRAIEDQERFLSLEERLRMELAEKSNLQTVERQRLEKQLIETMTIQSQDGLALEALEKRLSQSDDRDHNLAQQFNSLREQMWGLREEVLNNFATLAQLTEQSRRRQIANLEQSILELKAQYGEGAKN